MTVVVKMQEKIFVDVAFNFDNSAGGRNKTIKLGSLHQYTAWLALDDRVM